MIETNHSRRVIGSALLCALVMCLPFGFRVPSAAVRILQSHNPSFLNDTETGHNVRFSPSFGAFSPDFAESPPPALPKPAEPVIPFYHGAEAISVYYAARKDPDLEKLLRQKLEWNLYGEAPAVLILHTHSTESYTRREESYEEVSSWRTLDENYNMLSIGAQVAELLKERGISVIHDREIYDYPSYNGAYVRTRKAIKKTLEAYPSVQLVLDLHRDASDGSRQMRTQAKVAGEDSAQLMVVVGTNHRAYEENLSLGLKLHAQLERQAPGIMRPLQLRAQRFNQDLNPCSLIVEVGAAGNTHGEARLAAGALAEAVVALARGTQ